MIKGGAHAGDAGPLWEFERYRSRSPRRRVELSALALLGVLMTVLALIDRRELGAGVCAAGTICVLVSGGLRVPLGVPLTTAGLVAAYLAALSGRFDDIDAFIFFGSVLTFLLAISALGFRNDDERGEAWGEPARGALLPPAVPGPLLSTSHWGSRERRFKLQHASMVLVGLLCLAYVLMNQDGAWRGVVAVIGTGVVLLGGIFRTPAWAVPCWCGLLLALIGALAVPSALGWMLPAVPAVALAFIIRDVAWAEVDSRMGRDE